MELVASTLHTTSEHGVSSITTADAAHLGCAAVAELTPRPPADINGLARFARKKKPGFCACDVTFQLASTTSYVSTGLYDKYLTNKQTAGRQRSGNMKQDTNLPTEQKC
jgi:hypothetical protein